RSNNPSARGGDGRSPARRRAQPHRRVREEIGESVKKRILFVQKAPDTHVQLLRAIGSRYDLFAVSSADEAIEACRTVGPVALAVAENGLKGTSAFDLLKRVNESWPETVGLLIASEGDSAAAERAVKEPHVFRCVTTPCAPGTLLSAVDAALSRHVEVEV